MGKWVEGEVDRRTVVVVSVLWINFLYIRSEMKLRLKLRLIFKFFFFFLTLLTH